MDDGWKRFQKCFCVYGLCVQIIVYNSAYYLKCGSENLCWDYYDMVSSITEERGKSNGCKIRSRSLRLKAGNHRHYA